MGLSSDSTIIPGRGTVFLAGPNAVPFNYLTVDPADPTTYPGWECMGHTSASNTVALTTSGGGSTIKPSWWDPNFGVENADVSWGITVNSLQVDYLTLSTAFPNGRVANGGYVAPSSIGSVEKAVFVLMLQGAKRMGIYEPRVSLTLGSAPSISLTDFFEIQLSGTLLSATEAIGTTDMVIGDLIKFFPPTTITVPLPAAASATPPAATTGTRLTINGTNLQGTTGVTIGGTAATALTQVNSNRVIVTVPSGTAGSAAIVVTTPAGASPSFAYTRGA